MLIGAAWVAFNVVWISPRILPRNCWFELAIMNHGFATATTAQGMMLLRMVDRDLRTDAAKIYAIAAPLTAMFIGGGFITYTLPYLLSKGSALWIVLVATCTIGVLFVVGRRVAKAEPGTADNTDQRR
jgi:ESS family glutamate:Na+ symporter